MKKSYAKLFLFLLLITFNPTLSVGIFFPRGPLIRKIGKYIEKYIERKVQNYVWHKTADKIVDELTPSQQEKKIEDLSLIKHFLYEFGYLQQRYGSTFDDTLDEETIAAIDVYQKKFNLEVTSYLNKETLQQISLPRCGVPDINFEYNLSDTYESWPKGIEWFPKGTKNFTYAFDPENEITLNAIKVFESAFMRWSTTTKILNFTETSYDDANIKIGFYNYEEGVEDVVVGDTFIRLQLNSSVKSGIIRLDTSKSWIFPIYNYTTWSWLDGEFDLESVVMHQIGHLVGLDHSFEEDSIMYPTILPSQQRKVEITNSDNQTIHQLYPNVIKPSINSDNQTIHQLYPNSGSSLLTTLFLGFTLMVLLN